MSKERDELTRIIMSPESFDGGPASCGPNDVYAARIADAILAVGYHIAEQVWDEAIAAAKTRQDAIEHAIYAGQTIPDEPLVNPYRSQA